MEHKKIMNSLISIADPESNDFEIIVEERKWLQVSVISQHSKIYPFSLLLPWRNKTPPEIIVLMEARRSELNDRQKIPSRSQWIRQKTKADVIRSGRQGPQRTGITEHFARAKPFLGSGRIVSRKLSLLPLRTTRSDSLIWCWWVFISNVKSAPLLLRTPYLFPSLYSWFNDGYN